jgi:hypothetical protein
MTAHFSDRNGEALEIGDVARNGESNWLGRIVAWEEREGYILAQMNGIQTLKWHLFSRPLRECVSDTDVEWHAPGDLALHIPADRFDRS